MLALLYPVTDPRPASNVSMVWLKLGMAIAGATTALDTVRSTGLAWLLSRGCGNAGYLTGSAPVTCPISMSLEATRPCPFPVVSVSMTGMQLSLCLSQSTPPHRSNRVTLAALLLASRLAIAHLEQMARSLRCSGIVCVIIKDQVKTFLEKI